MTASDADMTDADAAAADAGWRAGVARGWGASCAAAGPRPCGEDAAGKAAGDSSAQPAVKRNVRRPRRKKEEAETKELFAFYEQSLF